MSNPLTEIQLEGEATIYKAYELGYREATKEVTEGTKLYEKGLEDAWECAKKIVSADGLKFEQLEEIFGKRNFLHILDDYSALEAINKIKEYEDGEKEKANKIEVGDEVITNYNETRGVVTRLFENINGVPFATQINCYGVSKIDNLEDLQKTGRHFPQIVEILKQMREDK